VSALWHSTVLKLVSGSVCSPCSAGWCTTFWCSCDIDPLTQPAVPTPIVIPGLFRNLNIAPGKLRAHEWQAGPHRGGSHFQIAPSHWAALQGLRPCAKCMCASAVCRLRQLPKRLCWIKSVQPSASAQPQAEGYSQTWRVQANKPAWANSSNLPAWRLQFGCSGLTGNTLRHASCRH
jgi:hypothetical protein